MESGVVSPCPQAGAEAEVVAASDMLGGRQQSGSSAAAAGTASSSVGMKLVVKARGAGDACTVPHGCPRCPASLCKGREVQALRHAGAGRRFVFVGEGAGDVCAALALGREDFVLARRGGALAAYLERGAGAGGGQQQQVVAKVVMWSGQEELGTMVQQLFSGGGSV